MFKYGIVTDDEMGSIFEKELGLFDNEQKAQEEVERMKREGDIQPGLQGAEVVKVDVDEETGDIAEIYHPEFM